MTRWKWCKVLFVIKGHLNNMWHLFGTYLTPPSSSEWYFMFEITLFKTHVLECEKYKK